jgi:predicted metalloprotease with PDZ domain
VEESVTPDYNFKFKGGLAEKLAATDLDAALADKPKKKKKKKKLATTDALNQEGSPAEGGPDTRFFEVEIERPTGVEFATDLSLKYVYVMEVKDNSPAQLATIPVQQGDQLVGINGQECIGPSFCRGAL